jgi:hypothetical protein
VDVDDSLDVGFGELEGLIATDVIHQIYIGVFLSVLVFQKLMKLDPINGHHQMVFSGLGERPTQDDGV